MRDEMKVEDVMSKDIIVSYVPGTVENTLKILAQNDISGLPVLKKGTDKLVGVVTRRDIFKNADEDQLAMVLNDDFLYVKKGQNIEDAARLFYNERIHGLPVVNTQHKLIGIINPKELLKVILKENTETIASNYYTKLVVPVYVETPIDIIMEIVNITNEDALPVLDENRKVAGIVSDGDLFKLSTIQEGIAKSDMGIGDDEDQWTWEGIRDTVRMYHATSEVSLPKIPVREVMIKDVKTVSENTPVCEIAKLMLKNDISHIPIVESENRLIGMITDIDLMQCLFLDK